MAQDLTPKAANDTDPSQRYAGPAWDNSGEYPALDSNEYKADLAMVHQAQERAQMLIQNIRPTLEKVLLAQSTLGLEFGEREGLITSLQALSELETQTWDVIGNLSTYASCETCTDSQNSEALKVLSQVTTLATRFQTTTKPAKLFLERAPLEVIELYFNHPKTIHERFSLMQKRSQADTLLSEDEEILAGTLNVNGPQAWGQLYDQISGELRCHVANADGTTTEMGLAQAAGMIRDAAEPTRKAAWQAIQNAWRTHEVSVAAVLNSLTGWRLDMYERRSKHRKLDFLDQPVFGSRISRPTLDAMISTVHANIEMPRRALRAIAHGIGKDQLDPWDLLAPAPLPVRKGTTGAKAKIESAPPGPHHEAQQAVIDHLTHEQRFQIHDGLHETNDGLRTFDEGLSLVRDAFANVDPGFGEFVDLMRKNGWIEARVLPNKRQGAFCTAFQKSRTPRVFQTYMGTIADIRTLAHELGHAYHGWVMRDLPGILHHYPMTLAETASVFAETAFAEHLQNEGDEHDRFEIAWQNAESAGAFLLNIPARFEFECSLFEARKSGKLSPRELGDLTEKAWKNWYGNTLTHPERQFWMTKLHFSIPDISFYNYPYTFGYLFSLGIYALRAKLGPEFHRAYIALLRDTGGMTAEELVQKHLGQDISQPEFWQQSLDIVAGQVAHFEKMLNSGSR